MHKKSKELQPGAASVSEWQHPWRETNSAYRLWPSLFSVARIQETQIAMYSPNSSGRPAFAIFNDTVCEGRIPAWRDERGWPVTYPTERAAQIEIADTLMLRLEQFIAGARDFEDALTVEEYILPVEVGPDGTVRTADGRCFGKLG